MCSCFWIIVQLKTVKTLAIKGLLSLMSIFYLQNIILSIEQQTSWGYIHKTNLWRTQKKLQAQSYIPIQICKENNRFQFNSNLLYYISLNIFKGTVPIFIIQNILIQIEQVQILHLKIQEYIQYWNSITMKNVIPATTELLNRIIIFIKKERFQGYTSEKVQY